MKHVQFFLMDRETLMAYAAQWGDESQALLRAWCGGLSMMSVSFLVRYTEPSPVGRASQTFIYAVFFSCAACQLFSLRNRFLTLELAFTSCSIACELSRDRKIALSNAASDNLCTSVLGSQQSNFFSLRERQISCGYRFQHKQWHASTMAEPTSA